MAKATPIKVSFNAGELSPLLDGRTDQPKYYNGCSILENFIPTIQGPIIRRGGTYFTNEIKNSANRTWLRRFIFNVTQSYQLEFGDQYVRFYTNRGIVLEGALNITGATNANPCVITINAHGYSNGQTVYISGVGGMTQLNGKFYKVAGVTANTFQLQDIDGNNINSTSFGVYTSGGTAARIYEVATPYTAADLTDSDGNFRLIFQQSGDVLYITHNGNTYQQRKLSRLGALNWTLSTVNFTNGPFKDKNTDSTSGVYASGVFSQAVTGAANNGSGLVRLTMASTTGLSTGNTVIVSGVGGTTEANGQWVATVVDGTHIDLQNSAFSHAWTSGGTVAGGIGCAVTLTADQSIFQANHVGSLFYLEQNLTDTITQWETSKAITAGALCRSGSNTYLALNAATTGSVKPTHTIGSAYDGQTGVQWLYMDSGYGLVSITAYSSGTSVSGTIVANIPKGATGSTSKTYLWAHSLFSTVEGWPEQVALFRNRLSFIKGIKQALSVSNDFENFSSKIGGVVTADAAIVITLPDTNPTRWAREGNDFIIGTAGKELAVGEVTTTDPLGPSNIKARKQTTYGSRAVEPVEVGSSILFVTRSGQKLREIVYDWARGSYVSTDLTVLSEHIAKKGLSQITYQQEPYSIVWGCTVDGQLVGFTFSREQDVLAWHRHPIGLNGIVESVSSIPSPDGKRDDLWMVVKRTINGVTRRYVEWMQPEFDGDDTTIADAFYVDAGLTYSGSSTTTISGLDHLKNATVDILANGGQHPQKVVSSTGTLTLDFAVTKAQIGLPCPAKIRSMRINSGSPLETAQGKIKRITRIILRLLKSLGGKYGPDDNNLDEIQYRDAAAAMDVPPALGSGDKNVSFPGGSDTEGYVKLINDSPMPMTIITIVTDLQTNES